jgi:hypothetical protein
MNFHAVGVATLIAATATLPLAAEPATLHGIESGHFIMNSITNPATQQVTVITNDFADGVAAQLGKYTLIAREEIDPQTGQVSGGAFVITASNGDTIRGTYAGLASFQAMSGDLRFFQRLIR